MLPSHLAVYLSNNLKFFHLLKIPCSTWLLIFSATLCALGEACLQTEVFDHLGAVYPNESASAYAVMKFVTVSRCSAS